MSTQRETILRMLEDAGSCGVSSTEFYDAYLPRFPARIHELKKLGYDIQDEPEGRFKRWFLRRSAECGGPGKSVELHKGVAHRGAVENISVDGGSQVEHVSASVASASNAGGVADFPARLDSRSKAVRPGSPARRTVGLPSQDMERDGGVINASSSPSLTLFELPEPPAYMDAEAV